MKRKKHNWLRWFHVEGVPDDLWYEAEYGIQFRNREEFEKFVFYSTNPNQNPFL